jgi:hypothetical protein
VFKRSRRHGILQRISYRLDRFAGVHPAFHVFAGLVSAFVITVFFGLGVYWLDPDQGVPSVTEGLWWAITHMLDGGTVTTDTGLARRAFGITVTLFGLIAVAFLTGAFASAMTERIRAVRAGMIPIFERRHVLLLGWNTRAGVIVRELAASGVPITLVIVTKHPREVIEERVREQLHGHGHRLGVIVRSGDPATTAVVRRAAARHARAIAILPETGLDAADQVDRFTVRALLALRRVLSGRDVPVVVEVPDASGGAVVRLCAAPSEVAVVQARDLHARIVAHAVRQPGAFDVARQILQLDARTLFVHPCGEFAGLTFDEAHAGVDRGILLGLTRDGTPELCPQGGLVLRPDDRLLLFHDNGAPPRRRGHLPAASPEGMRSHATPRSENPLELLVIHTTSKLAEILRELDAHGRVRATILVRPESIEGARKEFNAAALGLTRTELEFVAGNPTAGSSIDAAVAKRRDVTLLLAPDAPSCDIAEADADQLLILLHLHRPRTRDAGTDRVVIEIRAPETRMLAGSVGNPDDFILVSEVVGMMLAQELHALCRGSPVAMQHETTYHKLLDDIVVAIELHPMALYDPDHGRPAFGQLVAIARRRGEIAIGVAEEGRRPHLIPGRETRFQAEGGRVIVLTRQAPE